MTTRLLTLALAATLLVPVASWAGDVVAYDFAGTAPFIEDLTGNLHHARVTDGARVSTDRGPALRLGLNGAVRLPEGQVLFPTPPASGYLEITVCPEFDLTALPTDVWDGWVVLAFVQKTSTNGLPDGYNELGLALHSTQLYARCGRDAAPFAVIESPLRQGQWTSLRIEWSPEGRSLFVNGTLAAQNPGPYDLPQLDSCPAMIGRHAITGKWGFQGLVADFHLGTL